MKKSTLVMLLVAIIAIAASCNSLSVDDPEYTGPWEILYYEDFHGIHNNSEEFIKWFNEYTKYLSEGVFVNVNGKQWIVTDGDVRLSDYNEFYSGQIE